MKTKRFHAILSRTELDRLILTVDTVLFFNWSYPLLIIQYKCKLNLLCYFVLRSVLDYCHFITSIIIVYTFLKFSKYWWTFSFVCLEIRENSSGPNNNIAHYLSIYYNHNIRIHPNTLSCINSIIVMYFIFLFGV